MNASFERGFLKITHHDLSRLLKDSVHFDPKKWSLLPNFFSTQNNDFSSDSFDFFFWENLKINFSVQNAYWICWHLKLLKIRQKSLLSLCTIFPHKSLLNLWASKAYWNLSTFFPHKPYWFLLTIFIWDNFFLKIFIHTF